MQLRPSFVREHSYHQIVERLDRFPELTERWGLHDDQHHELKQQKHTQTESVDQT
jgi:hypothetical protein